MQETTRQSGLGLMSLVSGILDDAKALMRQEAQLLKDEVKLELSKAGRAASGFGIGAVLAGVGVLFLLLMVVHGLHANCRRAMANLLGRAGSNRGGRAGLLPGHVSRHRSWAAWR